MNLEETMENTEGTVVEMAAKKPRKSAARKTPAGGRARKASSRRKSAPRRKPGARQQSFESVIRSLTGSVAVARAAIAEASGQGAATVRRALGSASASSRRTITRLAREWKAMDPKKKARVLAALIGAAAAASAPLVRRRLKR
jgi:hypothetical protein